MDNNVELELQVLNEQTVVSHQKSNDDNEKKKHSNYKKDLNTIIFLMYLYFLQGIPLGLAGSLPTIMASRKVSYSDLGTFSFVFWPFSIKLLWAPVIDSIHFKKLGRRRSWLIPIQLLLGVLMVSFANISQKLLDKVENKSDILITKDIITLTIIFIMFIFLTASQDVCVDGWALSLLSEENVSWQSICNGVGQTAGYFLGNIIFILLESTDFSNKLRPIFGMSLQPHGLVKLKSFMYFFGAIFIFTSIIILFFKKENNNKIDENNKGDIKSANVTLSMVETYKVLYKICRIKSIGMVALILLTVKIGLAPESVVSLKLIEFGVPRESITLFIIPLTPISLLWPLLISKYTKGSKSIIFYMKSLPFRVIVGLIIAIFVYFTPFFKNDNGSFSYKYYILCFFLFSMDKIAESSMFISLVSFFANISDANIGGTYMTLLTTLSNLGGTFPSTIILYLLNLLTFKKCSPTPSDNEFVTNSTITKEEIINLINKNSCSSKEESKECNRLGGICYTTFDSYPLLVILCACYSIFWLIIFRNRIRKLSLLNKSEWIPL